MTKKHVFKQTLALLLCICMLISALPIQALATESDTGQSLTDNLSISSETSVTSRSVFDDVKPGDWFYEAIQYTYEKKLFLGTDEKHFSPNADMTRGMFVTVLGRAAGVSPDDYSGVTQFTDVSPSDYFAPFVEWAAKYGVTNGTSDSTFSPHKTVNRQEMATFLAKYVEAFNVELKVENKVETVPADLDSAAEWAKESVLMFWRTGILQGDGVNFNPTSNALRAHVATLFYNLDDKVEEWYSEPEQSDESEEPDEPDEPGQPNIPNWPSWPDKPEEPELETYTVSFDLNGHGEAIASQTVTEGGKATEPTAPVAEGYTFGGWYIDAACTTVYDFNTEVTANITLYAKWTENAVEPEQPEEPDTSYTISFLVPSGVSAPAPVTRLSGTPLGELPIPFYAGYIFYGWYYDEEYTNPVSESDTVNGNVTLYGKYTQATSPVESNTPRVVSKMDVEENFAITVLSSDTSLTAEQVKALITAANANTDNNNVIQVEGSAGTYTIIGTDGQNGYIAGNAYRIILEDDRLTFSGYAETIREYSFSVKRVEEVLDVELKDIVYIHQDEISNVVKNGAAQSSLDVSLFTLDDSIDDIHEIAVGTFTYTGSEKITVGTTVAVYEGVHPLARENSRSSGKNGMISYVIITDVNGTTYSYKNAEMEDVLFTPDVLPVSANADTDGNANDNSLTVPVSAMTYTHAQYEVLGLDGSTLVDVGDYLAFYTGNFGSNNMALSFYAKIETVERSGDDYVITYSSVTEEEVLGAISIYQVDSISGAAMLDGVDVEALEEQMRQQAIESGFVNEAVSYLTEMVLSTDALTQLGDEYTLLSFSATSNGTPYDAQDNGENSRIEVSKVKVDPKISTDLKHYAGLSGLRAEVQVSFNITIDVSGDDNADAREGAGNESEEEKKEKETIVIDVVAVFEQEVRVNLVVDGGIIWAWAWCIPYVDDIEASVSADLFTYTGIDIDATLTTKFDDGEEEKTDISDKLKKLLDGDSEEDGESKGSLAGGLIEAYQEMMENETDMIDLVNISLSRQRYNVALIFNVFINIDFVVSADVNLSVGCEMYYENAKRYVYRLRLFAGKVSSETVNLVTEHFVLEFYALGTMHLRAGIQVEIGLNLLTGGVGSASILVDVGAYADFRGFFYYRLEYYAGSNATHFAQGALYLELGVYLLIDLNMQVGGGKYSFNPTLVNEEFPLWSIGENDVLIDFAMEQEDVDDINLKHGNTLVEIPRELMEMTYLNLENGDDYTKQYAPDSIGAFFVVTFDNPAFSLSSDGTYIQIDTSDALELDTVMTITWMGNPYLFSSEPMHRTVNIHWDDIRDSGYFINFNSNGGSTVNSISAAYGAAFELPADPTRQGYIFEGWYTGENLTTRYTKPDTMPAVDTNLYAKWTPRSDMPYTVEHHWERADGKGYEIFETENLVGVTDTTVTPAVKNYIGFTSPGAAELTIAADGTAKMIYRYTRLKYTLSFQSGYEGGYSITKVYRYGATISPVVMSRPGYVCTGWDIEIPATMPANNLTATAQWTEATDTRYTVRHYVESFEDGVYELVSTTPGYGTTNSTITLTDSVLDDLLVEDGIVYNHAELNKQTATTATIKADGSLHFDLYYTRQSHTLRWEFNGGTTTNTSYTQGQLPYGSNISAPTLVRTGYNFGGWFTDADLTQPYNGETMPAEDLTLYAKWDPLADITYQVEHYVENLTGTTELKQTDSGKGSTGEVLDIDNLVATDLLVENGIVFDHAAVGDETVTEIIIPGDGSLVVKLYYTRLSHTLSWDFGRGTAKDTSSYTEAGMRPYGSQVVTPELVRQGYNFVGWYTNAAFTQPYDGTTMPAKDLTLYARWTEADGITYTVEYYLQNANDDVYVINPDTTLHLIGTTGSLVTAPKKNIDHFTLDLTVDGTVDSGIVAADGSLVLKLYYGRNSYTITYVVDGVEYGSGTFRHGQQVSYPTAPEAEDGYTFGGWSWNGELFNGVMPTEDIVLNAIWATEDQYPYVVNYYKEGLNGGENELVESISCTGEFGTTVTVNPEREYTGFDTPAAQQLTIAHGATVDFVYERQSYSLHWELNGGTASNNYTQGTVEYGTQITAPQNPTKTGYTFGGWGGEIPSTMPANDLYFSASWNIDTYTITYQTTVGTNTSSNPVEYTVESGDITLTDLSCEGYTFDGWYTSADYAGDRVTSIPTGSTGNKTLYAKWTKIPYTITYVDAANGENNVVNSNPSTYDVESNEITLTEPTRMGYTFGGWYADEELNTPADTTILAGSIGNKIFYAKWEIETYTITYDLNYPESTVSVPTAAEGNLESYTVETDSFTLNSPERTGYKFLGWFTTSDGQGEKIESIAQGSRAGDLKLYAVWEVITYSITYYEVEHCLTCGQLGEPVLSDSIYHTTATYTVEDTVPLEVRSDWAGYYLEGIYEYDDENQVKVNDSQVTSIEAGSTGDKTFLLVHTGQEVLLQLIGYRMTPPQEFVHYSICSSDEHTVSIPDTFTVSSLSGSPPSTVQTKLSDFRWEGTETALGEAIPASYEYLVSVLGEDALPADFKLGTKYFIGKELEWRPYAIRIEKINATEVSD